MELLVKKHLNPMFLFLLVATVPTIIGAQFAIKSEEYQQTKNVELNVTRVDLGNKLSRIQCSRMCSEDSSCVGVGIQEKTAGEVRCFKMNNDSSGDTELQNELIYLKGKIFINVNNQQYVRIKPCLHFGKIFTAVRHPK